MTTMLLIVVVYLLGIFAVGVYATKYTQTLEGFYIGSRQINPWASALSHVFTVVSAWVFTGWAGMAASVGPIAWWYGVGGLFAHLTSWLVIAPRIRVYAERLEALTVTDYFVKRVRDDSWHIPVLAGGATALFMTILVGTQFLASAKVLNAALGWSTLTSVLVTAVLVIFYCVAGGYVAVVWTDAAQGAIILIGSVVAFLTVTHLNGGWGNIVVLAADKNPLMASATGGMAGGELFLFIITTVVWFWVGNFGRPHQTIRLMTIRHVDDIPLAAVIDSAGVLLSWGTGFILAYIGLALLPEIGDPEMLFGLAIGQLLHPVVGGILLAAFCALMMSTADSCLFAASSAIAKDIYGGVINRQVTDEKLLSLSRVITAVIGAVGVWIALTTPGTIFRLLVYANSGLGATFGPTTLLSLYWKRLTKWGTVAGMASGLVTVIAWYNIGNLTNFLPEIIPAFAMSFVAAIVVSLLTEQPALEEIDEEFAAFINI